MPLVTMLEIGVSKHRFVLRLTVVAKQIRALAEAQQHKMRAQKRKNFKARFQPAAGAKAYTGAFKALNAESFPSLHF